MLRIFKPKYLLKDLLPNQYIDIHNHLLPSIDDGPNTAKETMKLISRMKEIRIEGAIATPHTYIKYWNNTSHNIYCAYGIAKQIEPGKSFLKGYASEYMLDASLVARLNKEKLLCIHDTYILVELPYMGCPLNLYEMLFELKCKNYKIIIAHPERYIYFHNSIEKFKKLKLFGVYFQLNLLSLIGYYGKSIQKIAESLIENDLYDFTGTDIHNEHHIDQYATKPIYFNINKIGDLLRANSLFNN
ncbi:tyrosine-protein phosphatase [Flavobacterium sp. LAR06]|uniref:tyrosine-protein phosphatase n=1 Tax=Flavobacterium sp. LAR06 TaxID=3064897 RepID=UPI0035BEC9CD